MKARAEESTLEEKTRSLADLALLAAPERVTRIPYRVVALETAGITREEAVGAIRMSLPVAGHVVTQALQSGQDGYDTAAQQPRRVVGWGDPPRKVAFSEHLRHSQNAGDELTLFPDDRAVIKCTDDETEARPLYAEWVGSMPEPGTITHARSVACRRRRQPAESVELFMRAPATMLARSWESTPSAFWKCYA